MNERIRTVALLSAVLVPAALFFLAGFSTDGAVLFEREGCRRCHRFKGSGGNLAPDLTPVVNTRSDEWIKWQILQPSVNNGHTRMPGYGHLSGREVRALIAFLKS